jgi:hypothetical protein
VHLNLLSSLQHSNTWPNAHAHTRTRTRTHKHTHTHTRSVDDAICESYKSHLSYLNLIYPNRYF